MATKQNSSLLDIQRQIADLTRQADELKAKEKSGVVGRIKEAIEVYGLTVADLFGQTGPRTSQRTAKPKALKNVARTSFADGSGNTWGGRGPRPKWLRDALASGKTIDEFAQRASAPTASPEAAPVASKPAKRADRKASDKPAVKLPVKYRDEAGNTWSGRGLQPRWLKAAVAQGKTLQEFAA